MKKSYDYFKTLKILSEEVSVIFEKTTNSSDYSSAWIKFSAEKSELLNNLQNEFITPLERGDIFLLAECIADELNSVTSFEAYSAFTNKADSEYMQVLLLSLKKQNTIFSQMNSFKSNLRLFEQCSDEIKTLNKTKIAIEKNIMDAIYCKSEQPLIKYILYAVMLDLNRKIYKTLVEIERILINNS